MPIPLPTSSRVPGAALRLAYREWNSDARGLPIVALHGITGSSSDWCHTAESLPAARRLIALDARGHGDSDWDPGEGYAVDQHFADIATALEALDVDRCLLAGFSMGGGVAIVAAACLPERIAGVAVIDAYPHPEQSSGSAGIARWVAETAHLTRRFDPAISRRFRELLASGAATRADLRPLWSAIDSPVILVRGAESNVLPAHLAAEMLDSQPMARLHSITGVGHDILQHRPEQLARILCDFAGELDRACE